MTGDIVRLANVMRAVASPADRRMALTKRLFWVLRKVGVDDMSVRRRAGVFHVSTSDLCIGLNLVANGSFDQSIFSEAIRVLREREAVKGERFLDIGANNGFVTVLMMGTGLFKSAICVEPDPENFRRLAATVASNRFADVKLVNAGLSDEKADLILYKNPENMGDYQPAKAGDAYGSNWAAVKIPVDTLDATLVAQGVLPDEIGFACIDVQGWEGHVLRGASSVLGRGIPILVELWPSRMKEHGTFEAVSGLLARSYNTFFAMRGGRMVAVDLHTMLKEAEAQSAPLYQFDLLCLRE